MHKEYQQITHIQKIDTIGKKSKKENCEKELAQLEKDIQKLSKGHIFVDTTYAQSHYWDDLVLALETSDLILR